MLQSRSFVKGVAETKGRTAWALIAKYSLYFLIFAVLSRAEINSLRPFAWGFYIALVFCGQNILVLSALYIGASVMIEPTVNTLIAVICTALVLMGASVVHLKIKKPMTLPLLYVYAFAGQIGYQYVCFMGGYNALNAILTLVFGLVFLYACVTVTHCVLVRKLKYRLNKNDLACFAIFIIAVFNGLNSFTFAGDALARAAYALTMLIVVFAVGGGTAAGYGVCCGLGVSLASGDITYLASFAAMAIICGLFTEISKIMAAASVMLSDVIFGLYFNSYLNFGIVSVVSLAVGGICFIFLPNSALLRIREIFVGASDTLAARHIVNRSREQLWRRLKELSRIFADMDNIFRTTVRGNAPLEKTVDIMSNEIPLKLCADCAANSRCFEHVDDIILSFKDVLKPALQKGRVNIIDIPTYLTSRCEKVNTMLNLINNMIDTYKKHNLVVENLDASRVLVAEHLGGISKMMQSVAEETRAGISFDFQNERSVLEELTYNDIICQEIVLSDEPNGVTSAELVLRADTYEPIRLKKIISKVLKKNMAVINEENAHILGWNMVTLKTATPFDVVFGSASAPKAGNTLNGDTFSFLKINDDKFLMALCDGMGAGVSAERLSSSALSLVENFYRAGFDNMTILSSVNKFLTIANEETFSALDICIVNLRDCTADLIKLGAPYGILKHGLESELIEGGTLPLGILEELRPTVSRKILRPNDIIIMGTDGITDVYEGPEEYRSFVNGIATVNPQILADEILNYCVKSDKSAPHDDMSVICARIFPLV